ncbi:MAG: DegT/DnrJ/EryC1/StrS family aminotransferase [Pyrinomonadaceae bacterium]|jgi:perosamine synthetase|nr:DegT/DnrJ/EryC1/StrS family aminotransferase [Pyrinomonadaceae bacterium]
MKSKLYSTQSSEKNKVSPKVPFQKPTIGEEEIKEVVETLRSGWLTTGAKAYQFEKKFAKAVNADYAIAVNSCTAALHLAVEAMNLKAGQAVLVPTMTFAATAEIILYKNAVPILVDCDTETGNMDLQDAEKKLNKIKTGEFLNNQNQSLEVVGIIPVHVGGFMMNMGEIKKFASKHGLWIIEDAAHAFPSAWRENAESCWQFCGEEPSSITCFSFYANKTITTGEGGMAVTNDKSIAEKIRLMSLHGLSKDAWNRFETANWDYKIILPGYKYNLTDIAAAIGLHQLDRAEKMRLEREVVAEYYFDSLADLEEIELPPTDSNRIHSWHLFPIRLNLENLTIDRDCFLESLRTLGVACSVHWKPLHLHPLYSEKLGWQKEDFPVATHLWKRLISLPIFSSMTVLEKTHVVETVKKLCYKYSAKTKIVAD